MPLPRRLDNAQVAIVKAILMQRRQFAAQLAKLPTLDELALQMQISTTALKRLDRGETYKSCR